MSNEFETFRDHFLSLYQSAVSDIAKQIDNSQSSGSGISRTRVGARRSAASILPEIAAEIARHDYALKHGHEVSRQTGPKTRDLTPRDMTRVCAELAFRYMKAGISGDSGAIAEVKAEFTAGTCDPAWATTIEEYLRYFGVDGQRQEIPYIRAAAVGTKTIEIKANARVALVGDWGTGAQPAVDILKQIAAATPDVLIHLGDIYYSGTPLECKLNFTSLIDQVLRGGDSKPTVFTLAGNYDMYCGGVGYYELIKHLNPRPLTQPASFFCLRSADEEWQLLAMDTGLHDYNPRGVAEALTFIEDDELAWHCDRIKEFPGRTILLSHHQLFSAFSPIGKADERGNRSAANPLLLKAFKAMEAAGRISAWFWGHEHTLSIYDEFAGLRRGRCLGHGAVPTSTLDKIYEPVPCLDKIPSIVANTQLRTRGGVYAHGYAMLAFDRKSCSARYFQDVDGRSAEVYSETID
jgi:3',5'-cyclic AMP phosphodiesterase CpdA